MSPETSVFLRLFISAFRQSTVTLEKMANVTAKHDGDILSTSFVCLSHAFTALYLQHRGQQGTYSLQNAADQRDFKLKST